MEHTIVEKLKREIERFEPKKEVERIGTVIAAGDGIAEVDGLTGAMMGEMVIFDTAAREDLVEALIVDERIAGVVLNLEEDTVKVVILGTAEKIVEGMTVTSTGQILSVPVGPGLLGRVVDPLGRPVDGAGELKAEKRSPIERQAYGVIDRASVNTPLHTGLKSIDGLVPIGRGQRELIIGDRSTGKTTLAIDTIINQRSEHAATRPFCIYVAIGQKEAKIARTVAELKSRGAMEYTIVVDASSSVPAALQYLAPFTGATLGEYFMDQGKDALIVYDDLSKHAVAYRQLSLLLRRPPGREAYPGDIFYLHSRLLERSAKLSKEKGGGSLTGLPIIETQSGDVSAYIPTNVISITDGQIILDADLFNKGNKPAINVGLSVSRVGSSAQTKAMKKVSGRIKLELAQFRELEAFMQFSSDLDAETKARLDKGKLLVEFLKQDKGRPLGFEKQTAVIYAATSGLFNDALLENVPELESSFLEYLENQHSELLAKIREYRDLSKDTEEDLRKAIDIFKEARKEFFR